MAEIVLSAALIVRNEERFLGDCLRSLRGLADEIVVVDTGSTDRTVEIARELGARLGEFPWRGDFAAARNAALDLARGAWILYIDADERVVEGSRAAVDVQFADSRLAALTVLFRSTRGSTRYREHRLFRNRPDVRFRGLIHETHLPALYEACAREGLAVAESALAIDHLGYEGDLEHKHRRNLPLLRERLAHEPWHVYSWWHLGATLAGLGDAAGAEAAWLEGIERVRAKGARSLPDSLPHTELIRARLGRREDVAELLAEALLFFPDNFTLVWLRGRTLLDQQRFDEALAVFERLASTDPEAEGAAGGGVLGHDRRIFGVEALAAAGLCCFRLGRFAASAAWYARAEALASEPLEYRVKRQFAEQRAEAGGSSPSAPRAG